MTPAERQFAIVCRNSRRVVNQELGHNPLLRVDSASSAIYDVPENRRTSVTARVDHQLRYAHFKDLEEDYEKDITPVGE